MKSKELKIDHCDVTLTKTKTGKHIYIEAPDGKSIETSIVLKAIKARDNWNWKN